MVQDGGGGTSATAIQYDEEAMSDRFPVKPSSDADIRSFLSRARQSPPAVRGAPTGRLLFALDATASRQPTWDLASSLQEDMFLAAAETGSLALQLAWYGGAQEFHVSEWARDAHTLVDRMAGVRCKSGLTQIERVLAHARAESRRQRVNAVCFVGDCMEEQGDALLRTAGELGVLHVPVFVFQEGDDPTARAVFPDIARLSGGAYCHFHAGSADQLRRLLRGVAVYASGGLKALERAAATLGGDVPLLTRQLGGK